MHDLILKAYRIINIEKRLVDGERGTGWGFLVEFTDLEGGKSAYTINSKVDWSDVLNPNQFAVYEFSWHVCCHNFSVLTLGLPGKVGYVCAVNSVTSRHLFAPAMI